MTARIDRRPIELVSRLGVSIFACVVLLAVVSQALAAASGTQLWVKRFNGPAHRDEFAKDAVLDKYGNLYVAGMIDMSTTMGVVDYDMLLLKYKPSGILAWWRRYNSPAGKWDMANAVAVDQGGYVYITGSSQNASGTDDYVTIKYSGAGNRRWVATYNGVGDSGDVAYDVAIDDGTNVIVTGQSYVNSTNKSDMVTVKYDPNGVQMWTQGYNGPANAIDRGDAIVTDSAHNVYVTGRSKGTHGYDYATLKYRDDGTPLWVRRYNGTGNGDDLPSAMGIDAAANVYVTGTSRGSGTYYDYATLKYAKSGAFKWVRKYDGPKHSEDRALGIAVTSSGVVAVTGFSRGITTMMDYATLKYSTGGVRLWVARHNGPSNRDDIGRSVAIGGGGNVYVTGSSPKPTTGDDYATLKYAATTGTQRWIRRYNKSRFEGDMGFKVVVNASGVYVTGVSNDGAVEEQTDIATLKYVP